MEQSSDTQAAPGVDPFLRRYLIILGCLLLAGLVYWLSGQDERVSEINDKLASAPTLADYPYRFRMLSLSQPPLGRDGPDALFANPRPRAQ
jgi:hypothetical protein